MLIGAGLLAAVVGGMLLLGNVVTGLLLLIVGLTGLQGYSLGAARVAAGLLGMLGAFLLAVPVGHACEGLISGLIGTTGLTNRVLSIAICGAVEIAVLTALLSYPIRRWLKKRPVWQRWNRVAGLVLGTGEGALLAVLLVWALVALEPVAAMSLARATDAEGAVEVSALARRVIEAAQAARASVVGRVAGATNPLTELRAIRLLTDVQAVLVSPQALRQFHEHPAFRRLQDRPSIRRARELLNADPPLIDLDDGLSQEEVRAVLTNPRFLAILDESGLAHDLSAITADVEEALQAVKGARPLNP